jgi:YVTN family beta-propeller protein
VASIVVSPADPTLTAVGATQAFTAEAFDAQAVSLGTQPTFAWSSGTPATATIDATTGIATAVGNGTTTITASAAGVDGTTTLTVAQAVASIVVSPADPTLTAVGATQAFTAEAFDANVVSLGTQPTFAWSSGTPGTATIDATTGIATAVGNGTTTITASAAGVDGTTTLTVAQAVASIVVTPSDTTFHSLTETITFTAEAFDANAASLTTQPTFTWSSDLPGVASIDPASGDATANTNGGPVTITAAAGTVNGTATATVSQVPKTISVTPGDTTLTSLGQAVQLTATGTDTLDQAIAAPAVVWTSSNETVATVGAATGEVTAISDGTTTITATAAVGGASGTATVTVGQVAKTISIAPGDTTLTSLTQTVQLTATATDTLDQPIPVPVVNWTSSDPSIASVDATGLVTANDNGGPVTITATAAVGGASNTATVTVGQIPKTITLSPSDTTLTSLTQTVQLGVAVTDTLDQPIDAPALDWSSSDDATATVSTTGMVTAVTNGGPVTITAAAAVGGAVGTATVTVAQAVDQIVVTPSVVALTTITTQQFAAEARDTLGNPFETPPTFLWSSSDEGVATIAQDGLATAVTDGNTTITASFDGVDGTATLSVATTLDHIVVTPATATLNSVGDTQAFTAEARNSGDAALDPQPAFEWSSLDEDVATVDGTGLATAVANGTATIRASAGGINGDASLTVSQTIDHIAFSPQPRDAYTDAPMYPAVTVELQDANSHPVATATDNVTVAKGTGSGNLSGTLTQAAVAGVATFDDLEIDATGTGYTLTASGATFSTESDPFNVSQLTLYVTNRGANSVSVLDGPDGTSVATITDVGSQPFNVLVTPDRTKAYVTLNVGDSVAVIETASNTVTSRIAVGDQPRDLSLASDGILFVANGGSNSLSAIMIATNAVAPVSGFFDPLGVEAGLDGFIWVTSHAASTTTDAVLRYNRSSGSVDQIIAFDGADNPWEIVATPDGQHLYVTNQGSGTVKVISTVTNAITATVDVGTQPVGLAITPDGAFAYVSNFVDGTVSVIRTSDNTVVATVSVGAGANGLAITEAGDYVFVVSAAAPDAAGTLTTISTATNTVVGTPVTLGLGSWGLTTMTQP